MLSSNLAIRQAYDTLLSTITYQGSPISVYWQQLPTDIAPGLYIIFGQIRHNDDGNKDAAVTSTSVTVSIYSNDLKYNDGVGVDTVANEVLNRIYKNQQYNISLPSNFLQVVGTTLESDQTQDFSQDQQNIYIDRILIFNHTIKQNVS